jgi:hypothetical protein
MDNKPTVLYSAGTYGAYLLHVLNHNKIPISEAFHPHSIEYKYTNHNFKNHHLTLEQQVNTPVIKITYDNNDISLINRNKWTKVKGHLEEQSKKTYPNNINKELYTMAIHICLLLDENNHFRRLDNKNNFEFKFNWFLTDSETWLKNITNCCKRFNIAIDETYFVDSHKNFLQGQQDILKKHKENNDIIAKSNKLGNLYFLKHKTNFDEKEFNKLNKEIV